MDGRGMVRLVGTYEAAAGWGNDFCAATEEICLDNCAARQHNEVHSERHPKVVWTKLAAAEILTACLERGDEASWEAFVACFQPAVAGAVTRVVGRFAPANRALVDDLVQETYLKLMRDHCRVLREFVPEHENSIYGFLARIADGVAKDYYRARHSKKRGGEVPDDGSGLQAVTTAHAMEQAILLKQVEGLLSGRATDRDRTIFGLYYFQGLSAVEIASLPGVGLSQKGVEACLHRLRLLLRECVLGGATGEGSGEAKGKPRWNPLGAME